MQLLPILFCGLDILLDAQAVTESHESALRDQTSHHLLASLSAIGTETEHIQSQCSRVWAVLIKGRTTGWLVLLFPAIGDVEAGDAATIVDVLEPIHRLPRY